MINFCPLVVTSFCSQAVGARTGGKHKLPEAGEERKIERQSDREKRENERKQREGE